MLSYWEKKNFLNYDLIVVGAGFVGLSTAIHFKKKRPKARVLILERGTFPSGASTKNAGFACFGSLTEILDDMWSMTQDEVVKLVEKRAKGLELIQKEFGRKALDFKQSGGFELITEDQLEALDQLSSINKLLKPIFKKPVFSNLKNYRGFGFDESVKAVVKNQFEGELDPGKYISALWSRANELGIKILTGSHVQKVEKDLGLISVKAGTDELIEFQGSKVAICTNAFAGQFFPEFDLEPGRGLVMVSQPFEHKIPWKGSFHFDKGYVYFRKIDGRLLLGGGRNKDFEGEKSLENAINPTIDSYLENLAETIIFPGQKITWEHKWTGIMAFGQKKLPIMEKVGDRTAVGVRLGGMGVAIGWEVGRQLSDLLRKGF
ncbi:NAD(P)/FAD-dependent oxidoreductase [Algoriphagus formosus]|uniref:FAD-binding oxidoreductase n=1 Tax=Algoriphagus formosus TaxID=2007308 RepID=A0A4R5UZQ8_9BACT|nr:FAD-dependent oxidoreductase [Algoriphagus aquimaris]TDK44902.1 FAD-binding oxidoreductase [Algoriphagus aquimaris]